MEKKATVEEIRQRFDKDVERFSNLETGQAATIDAPLVLELISEAAARTTPQARHLLDIGCGAGNNTLKILQRTPGCDVTLLDLSGNMLERARQRVGAATTGTIRTIQQDVREAALGEGQFDVAVAAAVLHHLRGEEEWRTVFKKIFRSLRPGGSFWISDIVTHSSAVVQEMMWRRFGEHLMGLGGEAYRQKVFDYIAYEDTPRPLMFQVDMLRAAGFVEVEILHKTSVFAAFGGRKKEV